MRSRRIAIIANKSWEAAPLCAVLEHPTATYGPFLVPLGSGLRGYVDFDTCRVDVLCLQDFLASADQSDSQKKWLILPKLIGGNPDLVIAFGTAATQGPDSQNGSVIIGTSVFVHNTIPKSDDPWPSTVLDIVQTSDAGAKILAAAWTADRDNRSRAESRLLSAPINPAEPPIIIEAGNFVAVSDLNVPTYADYVWADELALEAFSNVPRALFGSLETTHGLIRLRTEAPFVFVSGITDTIGNFNAQVAPRQYSQNFVAAHNAGIAIANLLPALVKALGETMNDSVTLVVDFNNPQWVPNKAITVLYQPNTTVRDALFLAYDQVHAEDPGFVFDLRYSGKDLGDFIQTLCGVPTTVSSSWEIFVNDLPASKGIDSLIERPGDTVTFRYILDREELHATAESKRTSYSQKPLN